jgi:hypothetical protein
MQDARTQLPKKYVRSTGTEGKKVGKNKAGVIHVICRYFKSTG